MFYNPVLIGACLLCSLVLQPSEESEEGTWFLAGGSSGIKAPLKRGGKKHQKKGKMMKYFVDQVCGPG